MARLLFGACLIWVGCSSSHGGGDGGGGGGRDGGGGGSGDGSVARVDGGPGGRDGGRLPDGGIRPVDAGPSLSERCVSTCDHLVECGSRLGPDGDCLPGCLDAVDRLPSASCEDLFRRLADCLDAQPCAELRDRDPGRTRCAPEFVDLEEMCGLGG